MAYDDPRQADDTDESADTASFRRFVEDQDRAPSSGGNRGFRMVSLGIGVLVAIVLVVLLLQ